MFGENGLIKRAEQSKDTQSEAQAKEKLSLKLGEYQIEIYEKKIKDRDLKDSYLCTKLSELGPTQEATDTKYYEVDVDGWLFWVDRDTLEIVSKGKSAPILPEKIEMKESSLEVYIGEGKTIGLTLTPTNTSIKFLKWTSSDETIAKLNNGVVTGIKEGTATITVESTEDASIKATCTVTVKPVELTGISLNKTETTIYVNKTETLNVTYEPVNATYKEVTWDSSDKTVATVDNNGVVTGLKAGTTTITVTSTKNTSIKAECSVTVEEITEISNANELKTFRDNVNKGNTYANTKVVLTADIDLNPGKYRVSDDGTVTFDSDAEQWTPIGNTGLDDSSFSGTFDGQGHSISGLYINSDKKYQGLFGRVAGNSKNTVKIKNINVKNIQLGGGAENRGGIVAFLDKGEISECTVSGNIKIIEYNNNISRQGGVVGYCYDSVIENCYNNVNITSEAQYAYIGGILSSGASNVTVKNCYNAGVIDTVNTNMVGGIIGEGASSSNLVEIKNCYNLANVSGNGSYYGPGGIVGYARYTLTLNHCYNSGNISGTAPYKGGIIGYICNDSSNKITLTNCSYLTGTASSGIGYTEDTTLIVNDSSTLPDVLTVINGDNAFVADPNGGYPILAWQAPANE